MTEDLNLSSSAIALRSLCRRAAGRVILEATSLYGKEFRLITADEVSQIVFETLYQGMERKKCE